MTAPTVDSNDLDDSQDQPPTAGPVSEARDEVGPRERLVEAGAAALRERGGRPLPKLAADDVVARAGVPKSTLYQLWSNFDDFRREVIIELLRTSTPQDPGLMIEAAVPVLERGGSTREIIRAASTQYFDAFRRSEMCRWLLVAYLHRDEIDVSDVIADTLNGARDRFAQPLSLLLAASHRRPKPGIDTTQIAQLLVALYLGMAVREAVSPGSATKKMARRGPDGEVSAWPRVAVAVDALVTRTTEAVE